MAIKTFESAFAQFTELSVIEKEKLKGSNSISLEQDQAEERAELAKKQVAIRQLTPEDYILCDNQEKVAAEATCLHFNINLMQLCLSTLIGHFVTSVKRQNNS